MEPEATLIKTLGKYGVSITTEDVPEVLRLGADTFLLRRGVTLPEKSTLELYLILNEIREGSIPTKTQSVPEIDNQNRVNMSESKIECKTVSI